jgi:hypothetical protein
VHPARQGEERHVREKGTNMTHRADDASVGAAEQHHESSPVVHHERLIVLEEIGNRTFRVPEEDSFDVLFLPAGYLSSRPHSGHDLDGHPVTLDTRLRECPAHVLVHADISVSARGSTPVRPVEAGLRNHPDIRSEMLGERDQSTNVVVVAVAQHDRVDGF